MLSYFSLEITNASLHIKQINRLDSKLSRGPMGALERLRVNFEGEFDAVRLLVSQTLSF